MSNRSVEFNDVRRLRSLLLEYRDDFDRLVVIFCFVSGSLDGSELTQVDCLLLLLDLDSARFLGDLYSSVVVNHAFDCSTHLLAAKQFLGLLKGQALDRAVFQRHRASWSRDDGKSLEILWHLASNIAGSGPEVSPLVRHLKESSARGIFPTFTVYQHRSSAISSGFASPKLYKLATQISQAVTLTSLEPM